MQLHSIYFFGFVWKSLLQGGSYAGQKNPENMGFILLVLGGLYVIFRVIPFLYKEFIRPADAPPSSPAPAPAGKTPPQKSSDGCLPMMIAAFVVILWCVLIAYTCETHK